MRLIGLLVALLIIGFVIVKQLDSGSSKHRAYEVLDDHDMNQIELPSTPADLDKFEKNLNQFVQDAADQRADELDKTLDN